MRWVGTLPQYRLIDGVGTLILIGAAIENGPIAQLVRAADS